MNRCFTTELSLRPSDPPYGTPVPPPLTSAALHAPRPRSTTPSANSVFSSARQPDRNPRRYLFPPERSDPDLTSQISEISPLSPPLHAAGARHPSGRLIPLRVLFPWLLTLLVSAPAWGVTTSALKDLTCVGYRSGNTTCTAGEFTVSPVFSAAPGTPPFCVAGQSFSFQVELGLSGTNTDRQDVGFFVGQQGNDPRATTPGNICSVATFPKTPSPWEDNDGDACGDFNGGGNFVTTINEIKVVCAGDSVGALQIPYVLTYWQNNGIVCTGPADVTNGAPSKCNAGTSSVSGAVAVFSGAYVDVTKQTSPDGDGQSFSYTATGPAGSKVIALTGATLTPTSATGGVYTPATIAAATNTTTVTLTDGQTARFYINALSTDQTLTITEAATTNWESSAAISCSAVTGSPALTTNNATRTITAALSTTNSAAACSVTNTKRSRITLAKSVGVRVDASDQFTVSASGGGTLTGTTSATTSGSGTTASTTFYSTPNTALTLSDSKTAGPTPLSEYFSSLTCTNAFTGPGATPDSSLPNGLLTTGTSITPAPGDDITCTFTNTRKVYLTLRKNWVNALVNDAANITATGLTTLASVADTANETDTAAVQAVRAGDVITLGETFTSGSVVNYTSALTCIGTNGLAGTTLSVAAGDTDIVCAYTNTFSGLPLLSILKSANGVTNTNPGQIITYTVQISNTGSGNGANVVLRDDLSPYGAFRLDSYGAGVPFGFSDSASGLSLGTPEYSSNNGATWLYSPVSGGGGAPAGYDGTVTNWRIPMTGSIVSGGSFSINYQVIVK